MTKDNDFLDKISNISKVEVPENKNSRKGRKVELQQLVFEIDDEVDTELSIFTKQLINKHQITNKLVYDTFGRPEGWNMIYGLRKGSVSWERVKKWCELLGYRLEINLVEIKDKK